MGKWHGENQNKIPEEHSHSHSHGDGGHGHVHLHGDCCNYWKKIGKLIGLNEQGVKAMASTILISAAPFFILFTINIDGSEKHKPTLNVLLAFAAGGLLGDAFLHLIPHAIPEDSGDSHGHSHDHGRSHDHGHSHGDGGHGHSHNPAFINCQQWVLAGLLTFLIIEKIARVMDIGHSHGGDGHGHSHGNK